MAIGSVEELLDYREQTIAIAKKYGGGGGGIQKQVSQVCSSTDIRTDANGYLTNSIPAPTISAEIVYVAEVRYSGQPVMGITCFTQFEQGILSGAFTRRIRLVDASGTPMANIGEGGLTDMGNISITYIGITP